MNAKYALALILALQVSMCLCQEPTPSSELLQKYNTMKTTFYNRLINAFNKLQAGAAPHMAQAADTNQANAVKDFIDDLQTKPEFQALVKVATGLGQEIGPFIDRLRMRMLVAYEQKVRPQYGEQLSDAIDAAKVHLDKYLPAQ